MLVMISQHFLTVKFSIVNIHHSQNFWLVFVWCGHDLFSNGGVNQIMRGFAYSFDICDCFLFLFLFLYNICICALCPRLTVSNGDVDQIMRRFAYLYNPNCSLPSSLNWHHCFCSCRTSNRFVRSILIYMVRFICIFILPLTSSTSLSSQLQLCLFEWATYTCRLYIVAVVQL